MQEPGWCAANSVALRSGDGSDSVLDETFDLRLDPDIDSSAFSTCVTSLQWAVMAEERFGSLQGHASGHAHGGATRVCEVSATAWLWEKLQTQRSSLAVGISRPIH